MAFPFLFESGFEAGTGADWDSESDAATRLDFAHYSELARIPGASAPWRGAYCMRVDLATSTTDAYVQEDDAFDIALDGSLFVRFQLFLSKTLTMADSDVFNIFKLQSTGPVTEVAMGIHYTTANGFRLGIGETTGATSFQPIQLGTWHTVELSISLDDGASNDGTIDAWVDGSAFTQVSALDQAAVIQARLGVMDQDAGTTHGFVLFDDVVADDTRLGNLYTGDRWTRDVLLTKSGHVFMGHGKIDNVSLLSGASTDNICSLYDTDVASTLHGQLRGELKNTANNETVDTSDMPKEFQRGCYVVLSGTNPRALVKLCAAQAYWSEGRIRQHGMNRIPSPGNL